MMSGTGALGVELPGVAQAMEALAEYNAAIRDNGTCRRRRWQRLAR